MMIITEKEKSILENALRNELFKVRKDIEKARDEKFYMWEEYVENKKKDLETIEIMLKAF